MSFIPKEMNYSELPARLDPSVSSTTINIQPSNNKSSFTLMDSIDIDLPKQGYVDPKSVYMSYKINVTNTAALAMLATPAYTPIARIEESCRSSTLTLNTIPNYNVLANDLVQITMSTADKYGSQTALGFLSDATNPSFDGRTFVGNAAQVFYVSAPLPGLMLTGSEKFLNLQHLGGYRLKFYIESALANIFDVPANVTANTFQISNFQVTCDIVNVSPEIDMALSSQPYVVKTQSYAVANQPVGVGSVGNMQISYANNFSSLRHVLIHPNVQSTNKSFDAVDITTNTAGVALGNGGYYQLSIGNISYPQAPLNTGFNKSQVFQELKKSVGRLYGNYNLSINNVEFNYANNGATTVQEPGKFILAVDTSRISANANNLLNGISTKNTPINLNILIQTATTVASTVSLLMNYDALINISPLDNQVSLSV